MKKYAVGSTEKKRAGYWGRDMDSKGLAAQHQFTEQLEISVALANREVIHRQIPNLTQKTFHELAVMVARFRASYLEAAIRLSHAADPFDARGLADLRQARELFDEGRAAFEALERAIERGYVDFGEKP